MGGKSYRWIEWNVTHIQEHGVETRDAELVIERAKQPYPLRIGNEKWLVRGAGQGGRLLQVIYLLDDDDTVFVIHARPLTESEKRRYRRRRRHGS